jgi:hypothetical protein
MTSKRCVHDFTVAVYTISLLKIIKLYCCWICFTACGTLRTCIAYGYLDIGSLLLAVTGESEALHRVYEY